MRAAASEAAGEEKKAPRGPSRKALSAAAAAAKATKRAKMSLLAYPPWYWLSKAASVHAALDKEEKKTSRLLPVSG
jgi:hypothetical protein